LPTVLAVLAAVGVVIAGTLAWRRQRYGTHPRTNRIGTAPPDSASEEGWAAAGVPPGFGPERAATYSGTATSNTGTGTGTGTNTRSGTITGVASAWTTAPESEVSDHFVLRRPAKALFRAAAAASAQGPRADAGTDVRRSHHSRNGSHALTASVCFCFSHFRSSLPFLLPLSLFQFPARVSL
jgi:hypothetical protein